MKLSKLCFLIKEMGLLWIVRRGLYEIQKKSGYLEKKLGFHCPRPDSTKIRDGTVENFINKHCGRFFMPGAVDYAANYHFFLNATDSFDVIQVADKARQGLIRCFSSYDCDYGWPCRWFKDPLSGWEIKHDRHWTRINELSGGLDIKLIWELSRFPQVYYFVRAYGITGDHKYVQIFWEQVESWIENNPYQRGPNWFCGQELSIRAMAWVVGLYAFKDSPYTTPDRVEKLVQSIYCHGARIEQNIAYALKMVKNNHAISEAAGLFTVGVLFPFFKESSRWRNLGYKHLLKEGLRQIYPDGSYLQHSFNYQRMVVQLYSWCLRLAQVNGIIFDKLLVERLRQCINFLYQLQDNQTGHLPNYGNNDGTLIFPLTSSDYLDYRPQLNVLNHIINGARLYSAGKHDEELFWFCGLEALKSRVKKTNRASFAFSTGGYYVLRSPRGFGFTRCTSYKDRPAQADMLHFDLWWNGKNVLCDAGTYLYNCESQWRNYFSGTASHNTANINGKNQMIRAGAFTWHNWTKSKISGFGRNNGYQFFEGEHYGYKGVIHHRTIINIDDIWFVVDDLFGRITKMMRLELHWLLGSFPWILNNQQHCIALQLNDRTYLIKTMADPKLRTTVIDGQESGFVKGWRSRYYGFKEKVPSVSSVIETTLPYRFISAFYHGHSGNVMLYNNKLVFVDTNRKDYVIKLENIGKKPIIIKCAKEL